MPRSPEICFTPLQDASWDGLSIAVRVADATSDWMISIMPSGRMALFENQIEKWRPDLSRWPITS